MKEGRKEGGGRKEGDNISRKVKEGRLNMIVMTEGRKVKGRGGEKW